MKPVSVLYGTLILCGTALPLQSMQSSNQAKPADIVSQLKAVANLIKGYEKIAEDKRFLANSLLHQEDKKTEYEQALKTIKNAEEKAVKYRKRQQKMLNILKPVDIGILPTTPVPLSQSAKTVLILIETYERIVESQQLIAERLLHQEDKRTEYEQAIKKINDAEEQLQKYRKQYQEMFNSPTSTPADVGNLLNKQYISHESLQLLQELENNTTQESSTNSTL